MVEFNIANSRVKDSMHAFLIDTPSEIVDEFGLKFFKSICNSCTREDCVIRRTLLNADMITSCNYFTTVRASLS